ncbi:hypothetical protein [Chromobacterium violaceum]|uniref:hypothetical protein n=1 Tax=Chromobacterium violaceum TaxID=536 RepID=UPI000A7DA8C3|nr:hypothetical protein [Chromobacterium violaceum]
MKNESITSQILNSTLEIVADLLMKVLDISHDREVEGERVDELGVAKDLLVSIHRAIIEVRLNKKISGGEADELHGLVERACKKFESNLLEYNNGEDLILVLKDFNIRLQSIEEWLIDKKWWSGRGQDSIVNPDGIKVKDEHAAAVQRALHAEMVLQNAKEKVIELESKIEKTDQAAVKVEGLLNSLITSEGRANEVVDRCEHAMRGATSVGLASSFNIRAESSQKSAYVWVSVLIASLLCGAVFGMVQVDHLVGLAGKDVSVSYFWLRAGLAVMSFAAPIWMGWVATKQLSERFRISEDYSYKAAVSMAYEGYSKEADILGWQHRKVLFETALETISQHPLRLLNHKIHGSPWHEALDMPATRDAIKSLPGIVEALKDKIPGRRSAEEEKAEDADAGDKKKDVVKS